MTKLTEEIDNGILDLMQEIQNAAARRDLNVLEHLTRKASEFRDLKAQVVAIENRFHSLLNGVLADVPPTHHAPSGAIRELYVEVTQGMINQNLLTLSKPVERGLIRIGERMHIKAFPSEDYFETELLASGNKLQERGKIGKFYRDAAVQAGDSVVLSEIAPDQWQLKKAEIIRYPRR